MKRFFYFLVSMAILFTVTSDCFAETERNSSLSLKLSTLGLSLEAKRFFSDSLGGRIGVNSLKKANDIDRRNRLIT